MYETLLKYVCMREDRSKLHCVVIRTQWCCRGS